MQAVGGNSKVKVKTTKEAEEVVDELLDFPRNCFKIFLGRGCFYNYPYYPTFSGYSCYYRINVFFQSKPKINNISPYTRLSKK